MLPHMEELAALEVLAEPRRRAILDLLRDGERPVGDLVERLGLSQPGVSKHLRVLKNAGLVEARPEAQRRLYRIRPEPLAELDDWLGPSPPLRRTPPSPPDVRLDRRLPDPPAVVWRALTERQQLLSWFPSDVIVDGGRWEVGAA